MRVTIIGPNLRDQSRGDFHVHAEGCADIARMAVRDPAYRDGWTIDAASRASVAGDVYEDIIAERGGEPVDYLDGFHFAPCCSELPRGGDDDGR